MADVRRPARQDTFDLRGQIHSAEPAATHPHEAQHHPYPSDEEHSVLESDSDDQVDMQAGNGEEEDYLDEDDDGSSSLSIPNESIDFDLVYSLHSFAATVEGQANVVKGDSLFLMDDSNSYWWLVRVLKTQEVGYIPAENIETPFERLARLNKHRNVDLASATQAEIQEGVVAASDRLRNNLSSRNGHSPSPSPIPSTAPNGPRKRGIAFTPALQVHRYPPAVWGNEEEEEDEDTEWDDEGYEDEDPELADEQWQLRQAERRAQAQAAAQGQGQQQDVTMMEPDDGMQWDESAAREQQRAAAQAQAQAQAQAATQAQVASQVPKALRPGGAPVDPRIAQQQGQTPQMKQQQQQQSQPSPQMQIRQQTSRERLTQEQALSVDAPRIRVDPLEATETRRVTVTPDVARGPQEVQVELPSAILARQEDERKRTRDEIEAIENEARKKARGPSSSKDTSPVSSKFGDTPQGNKLRKERSVTDDDRSRDKDKDKKGGGGLFGSLFRKKDKKDKQPSSSGSLDFESRESGESIRSGSVQSHESPGSSATAVALQQQEKYRNSTDPRMGAPSPSTPPQVSVLRQRDQQQQLLYQQYLNRSPASPPQESLLSTTAGSASGMGLALPSQMTLSPSASSSGANQSLSTPHSRPRPGSLVLSPSGPDGPVPELSVIRVFAGQGIQTEATFKTVLLNSSTTADDLVRQSLQRFRLPAGEDANDYYLTVKQVEGSSAVLRPHEKPLKVFETLVEEALELPRVKRSSVGSISSVASNLSMHPAIRRLEMNDFTDDSKVKFYLELKGESRSFSEADEGDNTMMAENSIGDVVSPLGGQFLNVGSNVSADRFSSPSLRFALQLVIYPEDLPDDMVFDPLTEAIIFKRTLVERERQQHHVQGQAGVSQTMRRKVYIFPKNVTVAEVIEIGLERFGILEGVVDGGDEVEDKMTKRMSSARVRYGLVVSVQNQERELSPSSRIIEAFPRAPMYRAIDKQKSSRRMSTDSQQLLGTLEDISPEDPVFMLRRSTSYRNSSTRHRTSAPLDDLALKHLHEHQHRESQSSEASTASPTLEPGERQPSRQEIIAAQRAAKRANQKAILTTQTNSVRGLDVLLPGNAMIRSSRYDAGDKMRYSYVEPDGETYDISEIVEEELRADGSPTNRGDLLEGVVARTREGGDRGINDKLDRVLSKIKDGKAQHGSGISISSRPTQDSMLRASSPSDYSLSGQEGTPSATPGSANFPRQHEGGRTPTPTSATFNGAQRAGGSRATTPTALGDTRRQPSIASVMSDIDSTSRYATPVAQLNSPVTTPALAMPSKGLAKKRPYIGKDDFGISRMMAIIELNAGVKPSYKMPPLDPVDALLFGREIDEESLHPQIREIYAGAFKHLRDVDKMLDAHIRPTQGEPF